MAKAQWESGKWRSKRAHWLAVGLYLRIVVRAVSFHPEADWNVSLSFGAMSRTLADDQDQPVLFRKADVEQAKAVGLRFARSAVAELLEEVIDAQRDTL